jgi:ribonuclease HI
LFLSSITVYTDGSCHTQLKFGAWAAIIINNNNEYIIKGTAKNTTHNRMELEAIINAVAYVKNSGINFGKIEIYTDSQYAVNLVTRKEKILNSNFLNKKGIVLQNSDLLKLLFNIFETTPIQLIKVAAHKPVTNHKNQNRDVDLIVRSLMRKSVNSR